MHRIKKDALFLIDGSYLLYRSYYGLRPLKTSKGFPTQAVYGFCRTIKKLVDKFDPQNIVLVWDSKGKTFRDEIYSEYKATRQSAPSDLFLQKEKIVEFSETVKLKQVAKPGYEADDLIGSLSIDYSGDQVVIVGPDKDLYQLLSKKVLIYDPFKDEIIDEESFKKSKGFPATKVPFFYALLGDSSDNIPGVYGIGKKTAEHLVKNFDSLEDLYKNIDKVEKDRTRKLLKEGEKDAFLSHKLFLLKHYDLKLKRKDFKFDKKNFVLAANFFQELEFSSLFNSLKKTFGKSVVESQVGKKVSSEQIEGGLHQTSFLDINSKKESSRQLDKTNSKQNWECRTITNHEQLNFFIEKIKKIKFFAFDTETRGLKPLEDGLVGLSIAFNEKEGFYIPFEHKADDSQNLLDLEETLKKLSVIFLSKKIEKIMHHAKFDLLVMFSHDARFENLSFDTLIAANLLRSYEGEKINLKYLSDKYLNAPMNSFKQVLGAKYRDFSEVPLEKAAEYAAYDALQTLKLKKVLEKELKKDKKIYKIFKELEMPLVEVLFDMETVGIKLNVEKLQDIGHSIEKDLSTVERKILASIDYSHKDKWGDINLNSPQQVEKFLFGELKLPVIKKSKKGQRSTDQAVLQELSKIHPIPGMILRYRELNKLKSTYIQPMINQVNSKTGRIHTSFSQTMVATGRLASSDPNLQNIPASAGYGIKIRSCFVAPRGKSFLSADYSQMELRVLAHMSKDKNLISAFSKEIDIHKETASQIFEVDLDKVTNEQRQIGKRINFGIIYGQTPFGLSKELGIKPSEAKNYIEKYFERYAGVLKWMDKIIAKAKEEGFVRTFMGRKRYVPNLNEKNRTLFDAAKRVAINSSVQGTSAEIIKLAMINLSDIISKKGLKAKIILQIHDELILELPNEELEIVKKLVKKEMEGVVEWKPRFKVDVRFGKNWGEISK